MIKEEEIKKFEELKASRFTINGNIITEIGEESISNPFIAIAELIKNSYDADAKQVVLNFENLGKHNTKIIIADDGVGMDFIEIRDKFMDIASPHKKEAEKTDEHNRVPTGAKGIGRFASHCLGGSMKLITASKDENYGYRLLFNWENFSCGNKVTDVDNNIQRFRKTKPTRGTTLIIEKPREEWYDSEILKKLLKDLHLLVNPIDPPKNFKIKNNISEYCKDLKKINKKFLEKAAYRLSLKLKKKKELSFEFFKNNKSIKKDKLELKEDLVCGDVSFDLYFYYKALRPWERWIKKEVTKKELEDIRSVLNEYGGIKMYRDKFRVKPYGDKNADWISLNQWARDDSMVPANTQVFGIVSIGRESNPEIRDTTTREGVIATTEYFDLVKFITTSIKLFVKLRSEQESEKVKAKKVKKRFKKADKKIKVEKPKAEEPVLEGLETLFIDFSKKYPDVFYFPLEQEINRCYGLNLLNACLVLSRKMVENLIYNLLEKKFSKDINLRWNTVQNRPLDYSALVDNLRDRKKSFTPEQTRLIDKFLSLECPFRRDANSKAHNIMEYIDDKTVLDKLKIPEIIELLLKLIDKIRIK